MIGELPSGTASASCPSAPVPGVQSAAGVSSLEGCLSGRGLTRWLLVWIPLDDPQEAHIDEPHQTRGDCRLLHAGLPFFPPAAPAVMSRVHASLHPEGGSLFLSHLAPPGATLFPDTSRGLRSRGVEIDIEAHFMELNSLSSNPGR